MNEEAVYHLIIISFGLLSFFFFITINENDRHKLIQSDSHAVHFSPFDAKSMKFHIYDLPYDLFQGIVDDYIANHKENGIQNVNSPSHNYFLEYKAIKDLKKNKYYTSNPHEATAFIVPSPCVFLLIQNKNTDRVMEQIKAFIKKQKTWSPWNHWMFDVWNKCYKKIGINLMAFEIKTDNRGSLTNYKKDPWSNSRHVTIPYPVEPLKNTSVVDFKDRKYNSTIFMSFDTNQPSVNYERKELAEELMKSDSNKVVILKRTKNFKVSVQDISEAMCDSKFCPIVEGDSVSSKRLFNAIQCNCIPIMEGTWFMLPFESTIPYHVLLDPERDAFYRYKLLKKYKNRLLYDKDAYNSIVEELFARIRVLPTYWLSFRDWI